MSSITSAAFLDSSSAEGGHQHSLYGKRFASSTPGKQLIELEARGSASPLDKYTETHAGKAPQRYDVHPPQAMFAPTAPTREAFDASPHYPVLITENPVAGHQGFSSSEPAGAGIPFNTNSAVSFESAIFAGTFAMHIKGLDTTPKGVFEGRRRLQHILIQGRFKRPMPAADLYTGHEWYQLTSYAPTSFVKMLFTAAGKMFSSSVLIQPEVDPGSNKPVGFMNPVLASCQILNISHPGSEPDFWSSTEDCRLLHPELADKDGRPLSADKRRKWFDQAANRDRVVIQTDQVVTLQLWQHFADLAQYKLHLGIPVDLRTFMMGQPLQIMAKDVKTGDYIINLCIWHKALLFSGDRGSSSSDGGSSSTGDSSAEEADKKLSSVTSLRKAFGSFGSLGTFGSFGGLTKGK